MSGGHWNYNQHTIRSILMDVATDSKVKKRFPKLAKKLRHLGDELECIVHELDWDISGDSSIEDDKYFEKDSICRLNND